MSANTNDSEITVMIPVKQATQAHIEHLQATLAKRNETIERLREALTEAEAGEPNVRRLEVEFKRGWQAAAGHLMEATRATANELGKLRRDAWDVYLQAERRGFNTGEL